MNETGAAPGDSERAFLSWLGFWGQFLVLGLLAMIGAFFASADQRPGDYQCGMLLSQAIEHLHDHGSEAIPGAPRRASLDRFPAILSFVSFQDHGVFPGLGCGLARARH